MVAFSFATVYRTIVTLVRIIEITFSLLQGRRVALAPNYLCDNFDDNYIFSIV